ncbi:MAG: hypothetical protein AB4060_14630 [Crocosphaera sp.]
MKAFLHIGTEKTGTTTIQHFLNKNKKNLLQNGYLYPCTPGNTNHEKLAIFSLDSENIQDIHQHLKIDTVEKVNKMKTEFPQRLKQEISLNSCKNVIFSNEHCSSRLIHQQDIIRLKNLLDDFFDDTEVIIYLRRQDKFLASSYSTAIISGQIKTFGIPPKVKIENRYDYYNILNKFANVFGKDKITVRIFESSQMINNDLIWDFMNTIGIEIDDSYNQVSPLNTSLDVYSLEYIRLLNKHLNKIVKQNHKKYINKIIKQLTRYSNGCQHEKCLLLSETMARDFMSIFEESNQQVAKIYLDRQDGKLFNDESFTEQEIAPTNIIFKLLEITTFLLKDQLINPQIG